MRSNFFYDLGSTSPSDRCNPHTSCCRHAIYMDATEHGFTASGNLIIQPPALQSSACNYGVFDNGGRNNIITGNLCVGYSTCVRIADYNLIAPDVFSFGMVTNFKPFRYRSPPYSRYPGLADLDPNVTIPLIPNCSQREECGSAPWHLQVTSNVAVDGGIELITYGDATAQLGPTASSPSRFNFSSNANVSLAAAGFEKDDPSADNCWGMKPGSDGLSGRAPGFERIRPDLMGPPAFQAAFAKRCGGS